MASKQVLQTMIPMLIGALILVLAMPMKAIAHDWDHRDNGRHLGWYRQEWNHHGDWDDEGDDEDDDCDLRPPAFYQHEYLPPPDPMLRQYGYSGGYGYGYGGYSNNPRMNYLQQLWAKAQAKHQAALANGNRRAAKITARRLYTLDRAMGTRNEYRQYDGYYSPGSVFGPVLGNLFGTW